MARMSSSLPVRPRATDALRAHVVSMALAGLSASCAFAALALNLNPGGPPRVTVVVAFAGVGALAGVFSALLVRRLGSARGRAPAGEAEAPALRAIPAEAPPAPPTTARPPPGLGARPDARPPAALADESVEA